jgi:hypothetical protein
MFDRIIEAYRAALEAQIKIEAAKFNLADGRSLAQAQAVQAIQVIRVGRDRLQIIGPDYIKYIQSGRRAGALKGVNVPVLVLIDWLKKKGVTGNLNRIAWAVQRSIFLNGIKTATPPRPFLQAALEAVEVKIDPQMFLNL